MISYLAVAGVFFLLGYAIKQERTAALDDDIDALLKKRRGES